MVDRESIDQSVAMGNGSGADSTPHGASAAVPHLRLTAAPEKVTAWLGWMVRHHEVVGILARKDFQTRYKRASFGVMWAVIMPLVQALTLIIIFSRVGHFTQKSYPVFVISGMMVWAYFSASLLAASTAVVDGSSFTDKVWFPRAALPLAPVIANLVTLLIGLVIITSAMAITRTPFTPRLLLLIPGGALLLCFTVGLSLAASALHVYFRDVRFIVQAGITLWFYATPIIYPATVLNRLAPFVDFNPIAGIVRLFQLAAAGPSGPILRSLIVSLCASVVLLLIGIDAHRRHDRLFVDLM